MVVIKEGKEFKMLFDFWSTFLLWKETDIFLATGISRERCHQFFFFNFPWYITHNWIVLFMRVDWLVRRWIANTIHLRTANKTKSRVKGSISDPFSVYWEKETTFFGPVWYEQKQLFTSASVKVVDITPLHLSSVNIYHYSPPLWWTIVNYVLLSKNLFWYIVLSIKSY